MTKKKRDITVCAYSPLHGWEQYMNKVCWHSWGTSHGTWSCKLWKSKENSESLIKICGETQTNRKTSKKITCGETQLGTYRFNHICPPLAEYVSSCQISCSPWTPTSFVTKMLVIGNKRKELITGQQQPLPSHSLHNHQNDFSIFRRDFEQLTVQNSSLK